MALPQQVIEQLSREQPETPGWLSGMLLFSGGIFLIVLVIYFGLTLGYEPYVSGETAQLNVQLSALAKTISPDDQAKFITYYSEIANLKTVLANHVTMSRFFGWLEANTEANVYYANLSFSTGNKVVLAAVAQNEADVNQQLSIFENAPEVQNVSFSGTTYASQSKAWQFTVTLTMNPAAVFRQ